jgi:hypothetical protein
MTPSAKANIEAFAARGREFGETSGKGVPMRKFKPYTDFVLNHLVRRAEIQNPEALLPTDGRPVVAIVSHGPGAAWIPLVALVGKYFIDNGYGDIIGGMVPHKALFLIPGFKDYYRRTLGTPTEADTMEDIIALLKNRDIALTGTAPEGANCLLSFNDYVAPFRSKGMIAAAIKADAAICLMAHQGAEIWNIRANLPFGLTVPGTHGLRGINITLPPMKTVDQYRVLCRRYEPGINSRDLAGLSKAEVRQHIRLEVAAIRHELNEMTAELQDMMKKTRRQTTREPMLLENRRQSRQKTRILNSLFPEDDAWMAAA